MGIGSDSSRYLRFLIQVLLVACAVWLPLAGNWLIDPQASIDAPQTLGVYRMLSFLSMALVFAALYCLRGRLQPLMGRFPILLAFCLLVFLSQVLSCYAGQPSVAPSWLMAASVLCGAASAGAYLSLATLFGDLLSKDMFGILLGAFLIFAAVLGLLGLSALADSRIPLFIQMLSPLVVILCGWLIRRGCPASSPDREQAAPVASPIDRVIKQWSYKPNIIIAMVSVGIVIGYIMQEFFSRTPSSPLCLAASLGIVVITMAIWLIRRFTDTHINSFLAVKTSHPFLIGLVALLPFVVDRYYFLLVVAVMGIWVHGVVYRAAICSETSMHFQLDPGFVISQTLLLRFIGLATGSALSFAVSAAGHDLSVLTAIVLAALLAAVLSFQLPYRKLIPSWHVYPKNAPVILLSSCSFIAEQFGLTPRESEVLLLLARGRNALFIAEEFTISLQTTKTHIKHIYAKLDVHSQQELLDLIDQTSWYSKRNLSADS